MEDQLHTLLRDSFDETADVERLRAVTAVRIARRARRRRAVAGGAATAMIVAAATLGVPLVARWQQPDSAIEFEGSQRQSGDGADNPAVTDEPVESQETASWQRLAEAPVDGRSNPGAVWTGDELLVWGGVPVAAGAAYDPDADAWRALPEAPLEPRESHVAVWTDDELIVWGGAAYAEPDDGEAPTEPLTDFRADGAAYDPAADTWRPIDPGPLEARAGATAVWTGTEVVIAGGTAEGIDPGTVDDRTDAAAYDPASDTWRSLPDLPSDGLREIGSQAVWTGSEMLVGGSRFEPGVAAAYDPTANRWRLIEGAPLAGAGGFVAWTGNEAVLTDTMSDGLAAYDPAEDAWRELAVPPVAHVNALSFVDADDRLIAVGGSAADSDEAMGAWLLDPTEQTWTALDEPPLADRASPAAVWTGEQVLVWSGVAEPSDGDRGATAHDDGAAWRPR